jgi:hypothetical protein
MPSRPRSAPCFCGSGRAFRHCCLRSLRQVRTITDAETGCRWRLWRAYGPGSRRIAGRESAEHVCGGQFLWIGRTPSGALSWMVDDCPVTLMGVLQGVRPRVADWIIAQTLAAAGPALELGPRVLRGSVEDVLATVSLPPPDRLERDATAAEVAELASELVALARVAGAVAVRLRAVMLRAAGHGRPGGHDGAAPGRAAA